jgi:putative restriction endonuclease
VAKLNVYRAKGGPAPHKPLLLLVVLELAEQGMLRKELALSPELAFRFYTYWQVVAPRRSQKADVRLPFHHLKSDGFWSVLDEQGRPSPHPRAAVLDGGFVAFAADPALREKGNTLRHREASAQTPDCPHRSSHRCESPLKPGGGRIV